MNRIRLYTTLGCHLCEQALTLLKAVEDQGSISVELVEISESDQLLARYGERIPVIQRESDRSELGWPFDELQLSEFLAADERADPC